MHTLTNNTQAASTPDTHLLTPALLEAGYIRIQTHPHAELPDRFIPISSRSKPARGPIQAAPTSPGHEATPTRSQRPIPPFKSYQDFDFAETVLRLGLSDASIDCILRGIRETWADHSKLTIQTARNLRKLVSAASETTTQVSYFPFCLKPIFISHYGLV